MSTGKFLDWYHSNLDHGPHHVLNKAIQKHEDYSTDLQLQLEILDHAKDKIKEFIKSYPNHKADDIKKGLSKKQYELEQEAFNNIDSPLNGVPSFESRFSDKNHPEDFIGDTLIKSVIDTFKNKKDANLDDVSLMISQMVNFNVDTSNTLNVLKQLSKSKSSILSNEQKDLIVKDFLQLNKAQIIQFPAKPKEKKEEVIKEPQDNTFEGIKARIATIEEQAEKKEAEIRERMKQNKYANDSAKKINQTFDSLEQAKANMAEILKKITKQ